MPGNDMTTHVFLMAAQAALLDPENDTIVPEYLISSYIEPEPSETKRGIVERIADYFKEAKPPTKREVFIISPFDETVQLLVSCGIHNNKLNITIYLSSGRKSPLPKWVTRLLHEVVAVIGKHKPDCQLLLPDKFIALPKEDFGLAMIAVIKHHIWLRTQEHSQTHAERLRDTESLRRECFWRFVNTEAERQGGIKYIPEVDTDPHILDAEIKHFFPDEEEEDSGDEMLTYAVAPGFVGRNVALPSDQIHGALSQFLGDQLTTTQALVDSLREVFRDRRLLSLGLEVCEDILTRQGQDTSPAMFTTIREMYGAVLEEQGLAYQQKSQATGLRLGIVHTAVIRVSEAQALVSFSAENDMYYLEDSLVDWKSVCAMVEGLAPEGLKGLYTEQVCKKLYDAEIFPFEKQWVQQACNWEMLRGAFFVREPWSMDTILVPDPEKSGTCPRCLAYVHLLSEHEPSCTGRCEDCVRSGRPCIRPTGKKTCVTYRNTPNDNYRDNFSHKDQAQPKQRTQCYKCWDFKEKIDPYNHIRYCSGRCEACICNQRPCERIAGKCVHCTSKGSCKNYSHSKK
ncbi:hypothetical protein ACHAPA_004326 [Fusarium lateritium]